MEKRGQKSRGGGERVITRDRGKDQERQIHVKRTSTGKAIKSGFNKS